MARNVNWQIRSRRKHSPWQLETNWNSKWQVKKSVVCCFHELYSCYVSSLALKATHAYSHVAGYLNTRTNQLSMAATSGVTGSEHAYRFWINYRDVLCRHCVKWFILNELCCSIGKIEKRVRKYSDTTCLTAQYEIYYPADLRFYNKQRTRSVRLRFKSQLND